MKNPTVTLTETDRKILDSYKNIAEGLADFWGNSCEVIVHSLESLDSSVIKIINGSRSGRSVGSPITDFALSMLSKISETPDSKYINYFAKNKKNEQLKSSISIIRGENNTIIGLFCINFFLNTTLSTFMQAFVPSTTVNNDNSLFENYVDNVEALMLCALAE